MYMLTRIPVDRPTTHQVDSNLSKSGFRRSEQYCSRLPHGIADNPESHKQKVKLLVLFFVLSVLFVSAASAVVFDSSSP